MAFIEVEGDLFSGDYDAIGHGVNCKGVMGAGIAKVFADKYPGMESAYRALCAGGWMKPGKVFPYYDGKRWVFNMATQDHPGADASIQWVQDSTIDALKLAEAYHLNNLAIPQIGCGIGGLHIDEVRSLMIDISIFTEVDIIMVSLPNN